MQRWEYKVVSVPDGQYTEALNGYGREGWELLGVASDVRGSPERVERRELPGTQALGKLGQAASTLSKLEGSGSPRPEAGATWTTLLWVLRRPLDDEA